MITEHYSSKQEGFICILVATAIKDHVQITLNETMRASSERDAIEQFEEWIEDNMEGFDWEITCEELKEKQND